MTSDCDFQINATDDSVQSLTPPSDLQRFEGISFSSTGNIIAVASSDTDTVFLFRRKPNGLFEDTPYWSLSGPQSHLDYPHDVSFSLSGTTELLAVAQRRGAITIYEKNQADDNYGLDPIFEICGPEAHLNHSDGVAFVPPNNDFLAACNLLNDTISFYRRTSSRSQISFTVEPVFELRHHSLAHPDGIAFSRCGTWLAVANHGNHTVSIFQRQTSILSGSKIRYEPEPLAILEDSLLRHPHSVAFTPQNHLIVTSAGGNYFSVYGRNRLDFNRRWSQSPLAVKTVSAQDIFNRLNGCNKMEGGPKGLAIYKNSVAICTPSDGVKIYSFLERGAV